MGYKKTGLNLKPEEQAQLLRFINEVDEIRDTHESSGIITRLVHEIPTLPQTIQAQAINIIFAPIANLAPQDKEALITYLVGNFFLLTDCACIAVIENTLNVIQDLNMLQKGCLLGSISVGIGFLEDISFRTKGFFLTLYSLKLINPDDKDSNVLEAMHTVNPHARENLWANFRATALSQLASQIIFFPEDHRPMLICGIIRATGNLPEEKRTTVLTSAISYVWSLPLTKLLSAIRVINITAIEKGIEVREIIGRTTRFFADMISAEPDPEDAVL